jgi:hypothetical protein
MKGLRYMLRNFTALSVKEHLRSQIERAGSGGELTPNEVELVRFAADRSDQLKELADRSPGISGARGHSGERGASGWAEQAVPTPPTNSTSKAQCCCDP